MITQGVFVLNNIHKSFTKRCLWRVQIICFALIRLGSCVYPQHFRPEAPPSEGPQYMNRAFSAYRGIYIEKEDLQLELNKVVLHLLLLLVFITSAGNTLISASSSRNKRSWIQRGFWRSSCRPKSWSFCSCDQRWRRAKVTSAALSQCSTITSVSEELTFTFISKATYSAFSLYICVSTAYCI